MLQTSKYSYMHTVIKCLLELEPESYCITYWQLLVLYLYTVQAGRPGGSVDNLETF